MITSIKREFNLFPNIVGIVTTDDFETITAENYFSSQEEAVELINNGAWEWEKEDIVLIYYATNQVGFFTYNAISDNFAVSSTTQKAQVSLSADDIQNMNAVPVLLLPSPGVGFANIIDSIVWGVTFVAPQYTGGGAIVAQYTNVIGGTPISASTTIAAATLNGVAADSILTQSSTPIAATTVKVANEGVYMTNATDVFAAGNSTALLTITFHVVPAA